MADDDAFGEETDEEIVTKPSPVPCVEDGAVDDEVMGGGTVKAVLEGPDGVLMEDVPRKPAADSGAMATALSCMRKLPKVIEIVVPAIDPTLNESALVDVTAYPAIPMGAMVQMGKHQWLDAHGEHVEGLHLEMCHDKLKLYVDSDRHAGQVLRVAVCPI